MFPLGEGEDVKPVLWDQPRLSVISYLSPTHSEQEASSTRQMAADSETAKAINESMRKAVPMADLEVSSATLLAAGFCLLHLFNSGLALTLPARSPFLHTERHAPSLARQPPLALGGPQVSAGAGRGQEGVIACFQDFRSRPLPAMLQAGV